jgi:hypothetical protein
MADLLPPRPPESELVLVHLRITGMEYLGRIRMSELDDLDKEFTGYLVLYDYLFCNCIARPDGTVQVPMVRWPEDNFWRTPILVPRQLATILMVTPGGKLWNDYASLMGNLITLHGTLPANIKPPPGFTKN